MVRLRKQPEKEKTRDTNEYLMYVVKRNRQLSIVNEKDV